MYWNGRLVLRSFGDYNKDCKLPSVRSALQHRLLRSSLAEIDASCDDLLLHNNVSWLSKGQVLQRFWAVKKEATHFPEKPK